MMKNIHDAVVAEETMPSPRPELRPRLVPLPRERGARRPHRNIHEYLANKLGREIVGGVYRPGDQLPNELDLRAQLAVSRTALREAYRVLTAKGLITSRPNVGTRVRSKAEWNMLDPDVLSWQLAAAPTEEFMADLFDLRQMIEPQAAARAARIRSDEALARLSAAYADMERCKDGAGDLIEADLRFHQSILDATGNSLVGALGGLIHTALVGSFNFSWQGAATISDQRLRQHRDILEAIHDRQAERAHALMSELLDLSMDDVRRFLREPH